jgi:hypothetical protein
LALQLARTMFSFELHALQCIALNMLIMHTVTNDGGQQLMLQSLLP